MFAFNNIRALVFIVFFAVVWAKKKEVDKPFIDYFTLEYLSMEQELWARINSGDDTSTLLSIVSDRHKYFITKDFGASMNNLAIYIPTGILVDNLRNINELFYNVSNLLLTNAPTDIYSMDIYYVHTILRDAVVYSQHVFNESMRAEFWENGKDVRKFNEKYFNDNEIRFLWSFFSTYNIVVTSKYQQKR